MGKAQVTATEDYKGEKLFFQAWPMQADVDTSSANAIVTDSAAAGTAMATGQRVDNGVISMAIPGDGSELLTALEHFKAAGKRTGLVTSDSMTGATPAAFGAHEPSRNRMAAIADDYFTQTRPNVLFGGGGIGAATALAAGYIVVTNLEQFIALDPTTATNVAGLFGSGPLPFALDGPGAYPSLAEMTEAALSVLANGQSGFFLVVEAGTIDHACHINDLPRMIMDVLEFERAVRIVADWAVDHDNTLVLVTADHETGGLKVVNSNGTSAAPTVQWSHRNHTAAKVRLWALGADKADITPDMANTNIHALMMKQ